MPLLTSHCIGMVKVMGSFILLFASIALNCLYPRSGGVTNLRGLPLTLLLPPLLTARNQS
jgi:hypothetical protein